MTTFDDAWRARFERFGRTWDDEARVSGWSEAGLARRVRAFHGLLPSLPLPPAPATLELGCGAGTYVRLLAGLGHRVIGVDYSLPSLGRALAADPGRKGRYLAGDGYALPFRDGTFDLVVSIGVLQALGRPAAALGEMARVLRPAGTLVVEALNGRSPAALVTRGLERLRRHPRRVRAYAPRAVQSWIRRSGLALVRRTGIIVPPRAMPAIGRVLDGLSATAGRGGPVSVALAHTFLYVARRTPGVRP